MEFTRAFPRKHRELHILVGGDNPMTRTLSYVAALNEAMAIELERDPSVFLIGEDIGVQGGMFTVTKGLHDRFGSDRVMDTPIAEAGFVGLAIGAAIGGLRPVVEVMFMEFALVAADQILNQATKLRFMSGGQITLPLTIRTQQGIAAGGSGPQHSQSMESIFAHVPGLAIAMPSTPADAKGLLATAIRSDEPTLVIEHKGLYFTKGEVPEGEHLVPFGQAAIRRSGADITLISFSRAVEWCLEAADVLQREHNVSAEVIDLRTIVPLDLDTLVKSVKRTRNAVIVQEAPRAGSMCGDIASRLAERCWDDLAAPIGHVTGLGMPVPYAKPLEDLWRPSAADVVASAVQTIGRKAARESLVK